MKLLMTAPLKGHRTQKTQFKTFRRQFKILHALCIYKFVDANIHDEQC